MYKQTTVTAIVVLEWPARYTSGDILRVTTTSPLALFQSRVSRDTTARGSLEPMTVVNRMAPVNALRACGASTAVDDHLQRNIAACGTKTIISSAK